MVTQAMTSSFVEAGGDGLVGVDGVEDLGEVSKPLHKPLWEVSSRKPNGQGFLVCTCGTELYSTA